ncbi:hypothetical protein GALMADRAFT_156069 [Galerina marginata CBS 339.88]|uniref:F-box domain-containing protein n=1 Tax=Galerina marginata (strain CBS 339.88) TaxID=685588 RepID=A0A067T099_GALM3|nr:hypothetical protein GALMADRAFT_156069 [Galerina marginata CBS 339.88]
MSEVRSTASAISKLTEDVLWHTFYFVAQVLDLSCHDSSVLTDLRHASQVCASWRRLLLASSSLWGMAIDLGRLGQRTCHWREEVLRRTGNSLLDIHGFVTISAMDVVEQFLASLLNDHWPRMRRLYFNSVCTLEPQGYKIMGPAMKSVFQKPAPYLESFETYFDEDHESSVFSATKFRLFADQAPSLQEFICPRLLRPSPQTLWLSNLRVLYFSCQWTARAILSTLANMPLLESLRVTESDDDELEVDVHASGGTSLPRITLPRLKHLSLEPGAALEKYLTVLEHLVPAPGLCFSIDAGPSSSLVPQNFMAIQQIFRSYLHISFKGKHPNYLKIIQKRYSIVIDLSRDSYDSEFDFHLSFLELEDIQDPYVAMFFETLRSISFEYTTKLSLDIHAGPTKTVLNFSILPSMASIKELHVTAESLQLLLSFPTATGYILFPLLKTLQLVGYCDEAFLLGFLTSRHALKLPIRFLVFFPSQSQPQNYVWGFHDFRPLEQFEGLKITWSPPRKDDVHEYICGSGNPDILYYISYRTL